MVVGARTVILELPIFRGLSFLNSMFWKDMNTTRQPYVLYFLHCFVSLPCLQGKERDTEISLQGKRDISYRIGDEAVIFHR